MVVKIIVMIASKIIIYMMIMINFWKEKEKNKIKIVSGKYESNKLFIVVLNKCLRNYVCY